MRYGLATHLADYGFAFLEKLHEPIFLVDRRGRIVKMNEAARKFMSISRMNPLRLDVLEKTLGETLSKTPLKSFQRLIFGEKKRQLILRDFPDSDYLLVELISGPSFKAS